MSVIGNPILVGKNGGEISDTDAVLIVLKPTGSTVTATKGGIVLTPTMRVKSDNSDFDYALFMIPASMFDSQNAWTVQDALGSKTIIIDDNRQYTLKLYVEYLRSLAAQTSYTRLSDTTGDVFAYTYGGGGGREAITRTSNEPVLVLNLYNSAGNCGFGAISPYSTFNHSGAHMGSFGPFYTDNGTPYYYHFSWNAQPSYSITSITYTLNGSEISIPKAIDGDNPYFYIQSSIEGTNAAKVSELKSMIDLLAVEAG